MMRYLSLAIVVCAYVAASVTLLLAEKAVWGLVAFIAALLLSLVSAGAVGRKTSH